MPSKVARLNSSQTSSETETETEAGQSSQQRPTAARRDADPDSSQNSVDQDTAQVTKITLQAICDISPPSRLLFPAVSRFFWATVGSMTGCVVHAILPPQVTCRTMTCKGGNVVSMIRLRDVTNKFRDWSKRKRVVAARH